jgi:ankyrin repeat protein
VPISPEEEARYEELQHLALDFARTGNTEALMPMIHAGMSANLSDSKGNTLLMLAAYHNHLDTVSALLETGASVDQRNDRGQTPLAGVCFKGHAPIALRLLKAGADAKADNGLGATPITFAMMFGHHQLAKTLLEKSDARPSAKQRIGLAFSRMIGALRSNRV